MANENYTKEYFMGQISEFRKVITSKNYKRKQKDDAFHGLIYCYFNREIMSEVDETQCVTLFEATRMEWKMRMRFEPLI